MTPVVSQYVQLSHCMATLFEPLIVKIANMQCASVVHL